MITKCVFCPSWWISPKGWSWDRYTSILFQMGEWQEPQDGAEVWPVGLYEGTCFPLWGLLTGCTANVPGTTPGSTVHPVPWFLFPNVPKNIPFFCPLSVCYSRLSSCQVALFPRGPVALLAPCWQWTHRHMARPHCWQVPIYFPRTWLSSHGNQLMKIDAQEREWSQPHITYLLPLRHLLKLLWVFYTRPVCKPVPECNRLGYRRMILLGHARNAVGERRKGEMVSKPSIFYHDLSIWSPQLNSTAKHLGIRVWIFISCLFFFNWGLVYFFLQ